MPGPLPAATRILHHPGDQFFERVPGMAGQFWNQRRRRHTWLGVNFEANEFTIGPRFVVETEISSRNASAPKCSMCPQGYLSDFFVNFWCHGSRDQVRGA